MESESEEIDFECLHTILSDDDVEDDDDEMFVPAKNFCSPIDIQLKKINQLKSDQNLSNVTTVKIVKMINSTSGAKLKLPEVKKQIQESAANQSKIQIPTIFVFCECKRLVLNNQECSSCKKVAKKKSKENNFLVHFALLPHIKRLLKKHFDAVLNYKNRNRAHFTDIDNGKLFRNTSESLENNLAALTLNVDGATLSNSGGKELWPVQMYLNCLPPDIRYLPENIIITTFYFSKNKPPMSDLLYPLCNELDKCDVVSVESPEHDLIFFLVRILIFACDIPARTAIQNFIGPNGYYGCPYCIQKGTPIKNLTSGSTVRYPKPDNICLRTHNETINLMKRAESGSKVNLFGVKGVGPIVAFPRGCDIINSFSIDFMHGIGLGVAKDLIKIWIGSRIIPNTPYEKYKLAKKYYEILSNRILNLKPTNNFRRLPRSILDISDFKASEVINCVLYYLRYSLVGLLESKIVKNFEKLSAGCYILLKECLSDFEIKRACDLLTEFADEFELIYGKGAITMNIHLLRHYHHMIEHCGPIWAHSLFAFENNIGKLKSTVNGNTDYLDQISKNYAASRTNSDECDKSAKKCGIELKNKSFIKSEKKEIWCKLIKDGITYTSLHSNLTKTIDYFIQTKDKKIGTSVLSQRAGYTRLWLINVNIAKCFQSSVRQECLERGNASLPPTGTLSETAKSKT